jgi:hypothetical protein
MRCSGLLCGRWGILYENVDQELPQWQKDILDNRLADLHNPDKLEPIDELFKVLDEE